MLVHTIRSWYCMYTNTTVKIIIKISLSSFFKTLPNISVSGIWNITPLPRFFQRETMETVIQQQEYISLPESAISIVYQTNAWKSFRNHRRGDKTLVLSMNETFMYRAHCKFVDRYLLMHIFIISLIFILKWKYRINF